MRRARPLPLLLLVAVSACGRSEGGPPQDPGLGGIESARPFGLVYVHGDGEIRVEREELSSLGADAAAHVEVRRGGKPVPSWLEDDGLHFSARDTFNRHTVHAAHELWLVPAAPSGGNRPEPTSASEVVVEEDRVYGGLASARAAVYQKPAPVWYLARVPRGASATLEPDVAALASDQPRRLEVHVYTAHRGAVALEATWGSDDLGRTEVASAAGGAVLSWALPTGAGGPLKLTDRSPRIPKAPARDVSAGRGTVWVDRIRISGAPAAGWRETVRTVKPRALQRIPDPLAAAGDARHVVIAVPALLEQARRLAAHRTATGTSSAVVPVTGIYARYGHGDQTPHAIRRFVLDLMQRKGAPLEYLVLAGDATLDRTDRVSEYTIPTLMTRTIYNGATASDPLYTVGPKGELSGAPALGRLPFRDPQHLRAFVDRVIEYELKPPAHSSRRLFRFVTSEGRFGVLIDRLIESKFRGVMGEHIPAPFDIEITFASPTSPFLWPPPELNDKVIQGLNEGSLFYTYVGHGFARGFDTLRIGSERHRILHFEDLERVDIRGTPPVMFVIACSTAQFDGMQDSVGEALMQRPRGPVGYWGASRICHPIYNALIGQAIATHMARHEDAAGPLRLGQVLNAARDEVLSGHTMADIRLAARIFSGEAKIADLVSEGASMYTLLGDPALKLAMPRGTVSVGAAVDSEAGEVVVSLEAPLPDGTRMKVSLEQPRNRNAAKPVRVRNSGDPAWFDTIRANHGAMNDWSLVRQEVALEGGKAEVRLPLGKVKPKGLVVKAWCIAVGDVHHGAATLK